jgi:hypothetical protein
VAIDLHQHRSLIDRAGEQGQRLETIHIDNDAINLANAVAAASEDPEVVLEATCGWYWAADLLAEEGAKVDLGASTRVELEQPSGQERRTRRQALLDMPRIPGVPEALIAPPPGARLRELVRCRSHTVQRRTTTVE